MPAEEHLSDATRPRRAPRLREAAALAAAQHGPVHHQQLLEIGFSGRAVRRLVEEGWLRRVHWAVYAVGQTPLTPHGRWSAAVLAAGSDAVLSHRAATGLWQMRPVIDRVDVTIPRRRRPRAGIVFHRSTLPPDERTTVDDIAVTTVGRTLLDLASIADVHLVERAANEAEARGLGDRLPLSELLARHEGHRGIRTLRAALGMGPLGLDMTESELEERFRALVTETGLPRPRHNVRIEGRRCDAVWAEARLIVEVDGRRWHGTSAAFDRDRGRDRALAVAGWRVIRVTARHLRSEPEAVACDLRVSSRRVARCGRRTSAMCSSAASSCR